METSTRNTLSIGGLVAFLAGCGGSVQIAAPQPGLASASERSAGRSATWMRPLASGDLLYVSDNGAGNVYVFLYPNGVLSETLTGLGGPVGECVDKTGDVWIGTQTPPEMIEYSHGGTTPIATLNDNAGVPVGCAVDPTTGNLAVGNSDNVAIYANARGNPTTYTDSDLGSFTNCTYDRKGDLFVDGDSSTIIAELGKGSNKLSNLTLSKAISPVSMQWNLGNLVIRDDRGGSHGPTMIDRFKVSGTTALYLNSTLLTGLRNRKPTTGVQYWIQGQKIIGPGHSGANLSRIVEIWRYPGGGRPTKVLRPPGAYILWGAVVSPAQL
jgi:hypothetical protein